MSKKQTMKEIFSDKINKKSIYNEVLFEFERREKRKMKNVLKYAAIPICLIFVSCMGIIISNKPKVVYKEEIAGISVKAYACAVNENEIISKQELKDNVKIELKKYSPLMSSVPAYPISFEFEGIQKLDNINVKVENGKILDWNKENGRVIELGDVYQITQSDTLYFKVDKNTIIKIIGMKDNKVLIEKNITISTDDSMNYYAIMN